MTECEEVALTLYPKYMEYKAGLHWSRQGHSMEGIRRWVSDELSATESYAVMDNVIESLIEMVFEDAK